MAGRLREPATGFAICGSDRIDVCGAWVPWRFSFTAFCAGVLGYVDADAAS